MRSGSAAPIDCMNVSGTDSFETGPLQVVLPNATRSGEASENAPFTRWPGSDTESVASPAEEVTVAVVAAVYSRVTPGTNAPNDAGAPIVSDSVAGTVPPTVPSSTAGR